MDSGTIITGAVCIILCTLPLIYMYQNVKKRERKKLQQLQGIADLQGCKITNYEISGDFAIGLDEAANFLFVCQSFKEEERNTRVNLNTITSCHLHRGEHVIQSGADKTSVIDQLELQLKPKNGETIKIEFYNADLSPQLCDELTIIQRWNNIVLERIA